MKDKITVYLNDVRDAIDHLRKKPTNQQAYTSQIIEEYMGFFYSNVGVPVYRSWNAQFGKILKKHASMLAQVTLLRENKKFFRYQISNWDPPVRLAIAKGDVVKTYPLA